ncbi:MAG TPA: amino acid adenylation domain-containing protein [Thermoanaerobaculia bacterium]|nr:amino acid adenylation domain-containing protein [Thermoanaerobaculia bacterium]
MLGSAPRDIPRLPRSRPLPLSFAQERLWFLDRLLPAGPVYHVTAVCSRLRGRLDEAALEGALAAFVARHEALRTRFPAQDGRPVQEIDPPGPFALPRADLSALPGTVQRAEARRLLQQLTAAPFDLARGPLWRAGLLRLGTDDRLFLVVVHHIVFDGWSAGILGRELAALYGARAAGRPSPALPALPVQPADAAFWQRWKLLGAGLPPLLDHWRRQLAGLPPLLALPTDHPRPAVQRFRGAWRPVRLDRASTAALHGRCREERATLFMGLLAGFAALLGRLAGDLHDVPIGTPVAGRDRPELEGMVGFFVNTLVLRADLGGDPSWRGLVGRLRQVSLDAFAHQDLPFARLVEELVDERALSHSPLVQVVFAFQAGAAGDFTLPGVAAQTERVVGSTAKFDLTLSLVEQDGAVAGVLEYDTDLFHPSTIQRWIEAYPRFLAAAMAEPDRPLATLPLLAAAERHQLLVEGNDTRRPFPAEATVHGLFAAQVRHRPDAVALVSGAAANTYATLQCRAERLAGELRRQGVGPEVPVGLVAQRSVEAITGLLAILLAGGAYVPLDPAEPEERRQGAIEAAGIGLVLTPASWAGGPPPWTDTDESRTNTRGVPASRVRPWSVRVRPGGGPSNLAYVMHTSGSTGRPRGVAVSHRAVVRLVCGSEYAEFGPDEVFLQLAPLAFDASTFEVWGALLQGGRLVIPPPAPPSPEELEALLARYQVTTLWLTAGLFHLLSEKVEEKDGGALAAVRQLLAGGDVLSAARVRALLARRSAGRLVDGYGPTEATTFTCCHVMGPADLPGASVPLGRPIANARVLLLDAHLAPVPLGTPGELWIGGPGLARGYYRDPGATADRFRPDPFPPAGEGGGRLYRSGDLARFLPDGTLDFLGRADDQWKIRGFRVEPAEIEAALAAHPAVRQAAVVAQIPAGGGPRRLVAYLILAERLGEGGPLPGRAELRAFLKERLPDYLIPAAFVRIAAIPLTGNGKVDRRALAARAGEGMELAGGATGEAGEGAVAPRTPVEAVLVEIWQRVLGRSRVGVHDNFFDLGGDSLLAIQMVSRASQAGLRTSVRQLFQHQTIAELAAAMAARSGEGEAGGLAAEQGWVTGPVPLTPGQRWFFERVLPRIATPHTFSSPQLLALGQPLPSPLLARAVEHLAFHHDALRLRFHCREGDWEQSLPGPEGLAGLFACLDLGALPAARQNAALAGAFRQLLAQTDLAAPLARFVQIAEGAAGSGRPGRLLLVLHHLVSDAASWRILMEDLETVCRQLAAGALPRLPAKTTAFAAWAKRQQELAGSPELKRQMEVWLGLAAEGAARLPIDGVSGGESGGEREDGAGTVAVALPEAATHALLAELPAATGVPFSSALLTGIARALCRWTGAPSVLLRQTDHGRNPDVPGVDLSRTVGWITTTAPVLLTPGGIAATDAQLRQVPLRGLGYGLLRYLSGDPEIGRRMEAVVASPVGTFNFLGRFDPAPAEAALFTPVELPLPRTIALAPETPQLRLSGYVAGPPPELRLTVAYGRRFYRRETMERLAASLREELEELLP